MKKSKRSFLLQFDRIMALDSKRQVLILAIVLAVIFVTSFFLLSLTGGDWKTYCASRHISHWVFPLYLLIDANAFHDFCTNGNGSGFAVFVSCIIYVAGIIIFTGMIISVMTNMIERRVEAHLNGLVYYLKAGHYVIMGYDEMVPSFIHHIFQRDSKAYVLILTSADVIKVREKLRRVFSDKLMKHIIINYGHRTTEDSYKDICLENAEQIYIVGYHGQSAHDAVNVECVDGICKYLEKHHEHRPKKILCVFKDIDTYAAFKTTEIFGKVGDLGIEFIPYNFYTGWAKQVFVKRVHFDMDNPGTIIKYPAVFGNGIGPDDKKFVHLVFVGTTNFAVAFAMEAAHVLHFPNFNRDNKLKTKITFIDLNADIEKDEFITRNRHFFEVQSYTYQDLSNKPDLVNSDTSASHVKEGNSNFLDVEFEFIKGDIFSRKVQDEICKWANNKDEQYLSIFLAMKDQRSNFAIGMNMPDDVYDNDIPIFIRQERSDNFVTNLRMADTAEHMYYNVTHDGKLKETKRKARYANIYPFGMNETAYSADYKSVKRAKLINYLYNTANYETLKFQDVLVLDTIPDDKIWEDADKMWKELSVAYKWSNLYNSYTIRTKLASLRAMRGLGIDDTSKDHINLSEEEVTEIAQVEHNRWNVEKLLMGYRKPHRDEDKYYAPNDDAKAKLGKNKNLFIHSDIRPFNKLGGIKELDREFSRYIPWIIRMTEKKQQ